MLFVFLPAIVISMQLQLDSIPCFRQKQKTKPDSRLKSEPKLQYLQGNSV